MMMIIINCEIENIYKLNDVKYSKIPGRIRLTDDAKKRNNSIPNLNTTRLWWCSTVEQFRRLKKNRYKIPRYIYIYLADVLRT